MLVPDPETIYFFVYGTLMPGERNHFPLLQESLISCEEASIPGTLYHYLKDDCPAITEGTTEIFGKLLLLRAEHFPEVLKRMNKIEECFAPNDPENVYNLDRADVRAAGGETVRAYVYKINPALLREHPEKFCLIAENSWRAFRQKR